MRVAFRVDASARIGGGHVMRCLTLADLLSEQGAAVQFVAAAMADELAARIQAAGHRLVHIPAQFDLERDGEDWHEPPLPDEEQIQDARASAEAVEGQVDWFVVDHYLLGAAWETEARRVATNILAIDDLANRAHDCEVVVDETLGREVAEYRPLVAGHSKILVGPAYAILRSEFARERPVSLHRRRTHSVARRVLISLGMTDVGGYSAPILQSIVAKPCHSAIDIVVGQHAPSYLRVKELAGMHPHVTVHESPHSMAAVMRDADLAVGAAGTSAWERCCVGLPSIIFVVAGNQRAVGAALEKLGASVVIADPSEVGDMVARLIDDPGKLAAMSEAAARSTDGAGASRVADELLASAGRPAVAHA